MSNIKLTMHMKTTVQGVYNTRQMFYIWGEPENACMHEVSIDILSLTSELLHGTRESVIMPCMANQRKHHV